MIDLLIDLLIYLNSDNSPNLSPDEKEKVVMNQFSVLKGMLALFQETPDKIYFLRKKGYLIHTRSDKGLKVTVMNRIFPT